MNYASLDTEFKSCAFGRIPFISSSVTEIARYSREQLSMCVCNNFGVYTFVRVCVRIDKI